MASVQKFPQSAVVNQLRHNQRAILHPANTDIMPEKSCKNYSLLPARSISDYDYFLERKAELYAYNRADVKVLAGWIVTAPKDLPVDQHYLFFQHTFDFLCQRYGRENAVQAIVHNDESGQPHLHFLFIPVCKDEKHGGEKICANTVLNRKELRDFHPALKKYLSEHGINANIMSGITQKQGGNRHVWELKQERNYQHDRTIERSRWR